MHRHLALAFLFLPMHLACGDDEANLSCDRPPLTADDCPEGWVFEEKMVSTNSGGLLLDTQCTSSEGRRWGRHYWPAESGGGLAEEVNDIERTVFFCEPYAETGEYSEWDPCLSTVSNPECIF